MCPTETPTAFYKMIKMYSVCNKCVMQKSVGMNTTPIGSLRVKMCLICIGLPQHYTCKRFNCSVVCRHFCKAFPGRVFIVREETFACSIHLLTLIRLASINTLEIGYSHSVLSASAVLIHGMTSVGFELLWVLRHNFILIYFRVF